MEKSFEVICQRAEKIRGFEKFHFLDCRSKPNPKTVLEGKAAEFRYADYSDKEKFENIYLLFSQETVSSGSLGANAAAVPKKGTKSAGGIQPVDDAFMEELDEYREILAIAVKKLVRYISPRSSLPLRESEQFIH